MHLPDRPRHPFQNAIRAAGCTRTEVAIGRIKAPICGYGGREQGERAGVDGECLYQN